MNKELLEKAKACRSIEELLVLAKDNGIDLTEAAAKNYFARLNPENGELADSELETVAGGCSEGGDMGFDKCPYCGASADRIESKNDFEPIVGNYWKGETPRYICRQCNRIYSTADFLD